MGWDFSMEIDAGGASPVVIDDGLRYTYNVSPMYYEALPFDDGIRGIDGMLGSDALPGLREGLANMQDNPQKYMDMNPDNGWGDYEGACRVLQRLIGMAVDYPKATFRVD